MTTWLSEITDTVQGLLLSGWDSPVMTCSIIAAVLAALWIFIKVVRLAVGILLVICLTYLILLLCFDIDISNWLQYLFQLIYTF